MDVYVCVCVGGWVGVPRRSWLGPEKTAAGRISPKRSTMVTEIITATKAGTRLSRNKGRASADAELKRRRVTRRSCVCVCVCVCVYICVCVCDFFPGM